MRIRPAVLSVALGLALAGVALAQFPRSPYTRAREPSRAELDRLNLRLAWSAYLPVGGLKDGVALVQWLGDQVYAQTHAGLLVVLDARTGTEQWRFQPDRPYTNIFPVAVNDRSALVLNGTRLYSLDRYRGALEFAFDMGAAPSAGPLAEKDRVYVCLGSNRIICYLLPNPAAVLGVRAQGQSGAAQDAPRSPGGYLYRTPVERDPFEQVRPPVQLAAQEVGSSSGNNPTPSIAVLHTLRPPYHLDIGSRTPSVAVLPTMRPPYRLPDGSFSPSIVALPPSVARAAILNQFLPQAVEPTVFWTYFSTSRIRFTPVATVDRLLVPTAHRAVIALDKVENRPLYEFETDSPVSAPPAEAPAEEVAYIPTEASHLFALNVRTGRPLWRVTAGGPITSQPIVTDRQVLVSTSLAGISCVDREAGEPLWKNREAVLVRAVNPKFVYAGDEHGRVLVIDRARGTELTAWDVRDFNVPVVNRQNDRLLLAANNGLLLCLHDKDFPQPVPLYTAPEPAEPPPMPKEPAPMEQPEPMPLPEPKGEPKLPAEPPPPVPEPKQPAEPVPAPGGR